MAQPLDGHSCRAGSHSVPLARRDGPSRMKAGLYFYRVQAAEGVRTGKFVLMD